jgi:hypothetical protein
MTAVHGFPLNHRPLPKARAKTWVEVRCDIDLRSNTVSEYYHGQLLSTHAWKSDPGLNEIQALDLYSENTSPVYYDNFSLSPVITIDVGRRSKGCLGFGVCTITIEALASDRAVPSTATWVNGRLQLGFLAEPPDKSNVLVIDEDLVLDSATARALGYERVTVRSGEYPMDYTVNPLGQVIADTSTRLVNIVFNNQGTMTISWPNNGGILQEATDVNGPWKDSLEQTSPVEVVSDAAMKYYSLRFP